VISAGCDHQMIPGAQSCSCAECGAVCTGKFGGCATVWLRGPRPIAHTQSEDPLPMRRAPSPNTEPVSHGPLTVRGGRLDTLARVDPRASAQQALSQVGTSTANGSGAPDPSRLDTLEAAIVALSDRLDRLSAQMATLVAPARTGPRDVGEAVERELQSRMGPFVDEAWAAVSRVAAAFLSASQAGRFDYASQLAGGVSDAAAQATNGGSPANGSGLPASVKDTATVGGNPRRPPSGWRSEEVV
jgi:hypothetical protein